MPLCPSRSSSVSRHNVAGLPLDGGILGSIPHPVVCQICFSAAHSAVTCPSRFTQPSAPALLTTPGEANPTLWFLDSGASAHMTATEDFRRYLGLRFYHYSWALSSASDDFVYLCDNS
ncbi:unnamed protein product [Cuscuta europaea]|uniref:Uncharacterized protein n=1 Tax=Cuscuta europaea TaxID=41803 RepID=A0A9P1EEC1_CUSEU|nr:unnamed protein product [Cuscuta europaea]